MKNIFYKDEGGGSGLFKKSFGIKRTSKNSTREFIAKLSRGLMLPIAMLPIAGLFLGIGATIATQAGNAGILGLETFGRFIRNAGDVIFGALPALFAIAVAIAFTKDAGVAGLSALIGYLVFAGLQTALLEPVWVDGTLQGYNLLFYTQGVLGEVSQHAGLPTSVVGTTLGLSQLQTSVFGGLLVGFIVAWLYNKFKNIQLPAVLGFFNGARFIPIVTFAAIFPIALLIMILWSLIGVGLTYFGGILGSNMLGFNSLIFGYIERALVPFGLHHAFYSPLWYSSVGGVLSLEDVAIVGGSQVDINKDGIADTWAVLAASFGGNVNNLTIGGDQVIWSYVNSTFAGRIVPLLGNAGNATITFSDFTTSVYTQHYNALSLSTGIKSAGVNISQYMQGKYTFMIFGLPAAAIAMIYAAPKENRKMASSVVIAAGFTSLLTGITEPIEFTFLFLAPWLFWGFHAVMCALSFALMNWIGLIIPETAPHIGQTFSGGILDWIIFGAVQIPGGSNAWWAFVFGLAYAPIYFFFFKWAIKRFNIATPGRGETTKLFTKQDYLEKQQLNIANAGNFDPIAIEIIKSYGGISNIKNVDACITKLRVEVVEQTKVDETRLKNELGAFGTIRPSPYSVYAIYGAKADFYKNKMIEIIKKVKNNPALEEKLFTSQNQLFSSPAIPETSNSIKKLDGVIKVYAPFDGQVVSLCQVPDETFSKKIIGDGVAIIPTSNMVYGVVDGKVTTVFHTGHAYGFNTSDGSEILLHLGVNATTLKLKNEQGEVVKLFKPLVTTNQKVSKHDEIAKVNPRLLKIKDQAITPVVILNESLNNRKVHVVAQGTVRKGDLLFTVE